MKFYRGGWSPSSGKKFDEMSISELEDALRRLDTAELLGGLTRDQAQEQLEIMLLARSMGL